MYCVAVIMGDLTVILEATLSPDTQAIQEAQRHLEQAAKENLVGGMCDLGGRSIRAFLYLSRANFFLLWQLSLLMLASHKWLEVQLVFS